MLGELQNIARSVGDMGSINGSLSISVSDREEVLRLVQLGAESWGFVHADGSVAELAVMKLGSLEVSVKWQRAATPRELAQIQPDTPNGCLVLWSPAKPVTQPAGEVVHA